MDRPKTQFESAQAPRDADQWGLQPRHQAWIDDFRRRHHRGPRVLGIGNIANNGYRNAIVLREAGVDCDVLCYGYFHIMGCPEWEDVDFDAAALDANAPDFSTVDLGSYARPRWFAQGSLSTAMDYLISLREDGAHTEGLWQAMEHQRQVGAADAQSDIYRQPSTAAQMRALAEQMAMEFALRFPHRADPLTADDLLTSDAFALPRLLIADAGRLNRLLSHYDGVIGYSIDGLFPILAGRDDFVAFEHGTIRALPFERSLVGRMCALTYAMAGDVLITNCDNILAARRMDLPSLRFTPHAMLEAHRDQPDAPALRARLLEAHDADFIVFHSARQHWSDLRDPNWEKGNDILIKAFAGLVKGSRRRALLIMIEWGASVAQSKALVDSLGIGDRVLWLKPMPIRAMMRHIAASDVLADQFTIGAWGGIMPIGMMLGIPVLIHLNEDLHRWCFPQMPPIANARTVQGVLDQLTVLLDSGPAQALGAAGRDWYDRYHSMSVVAGRLIDSLQAAGPQDEFRGVVPDPAVRAAARQTAARAGELAEQAKRVFHRTARTYQDHGALLRLIGPDQTVCYEYWSNAGAALDLRPEGAVITLPPVAWHYAAGVNLDYTGADPVHGQCWIRVRVARVRGAAAVCLYRDHDDQVTEEVALTAGRGVQEVMLRARDPAARLLLVRTGPGDAGGSLVFLGAEMMVDEPEQDAGVG